MAHRITMIASFVLSCAVASQPATADMISITADASASIRNGTPNTPDGVSTGFFPGRLAANSWIRGVLDFDLSGIPDGAQINSATLDLTIFQVDGSSATGFVGPDGIRVYNLTETFNTGTTGGNYDVTYNERDDVANTAWTTAGGTFDSTPVSIIANPTDPDSVFVGEVFAFGSTSEFISAVEGGLAGDNLQLIVRTPSIESGTSTRKIYRFASATNDTESSRPVLTVDFTLPAATPEPSTLGLLLCGLGGLCLRGRHRDWLGRVAVSAFLILAVTSQHTANAALVAYDGFEAGGATPGAGQYQTGTGYSGDALVEGNNASGQAPVTMGFDAANRWNSNDFLAPNPVVSGNAASVYFQTIGTGLSYSDGTRQLQTLDGAVRHLHESTPADKEVARPIINNPTPGNLTYYSFLLRYESEDNGWDSTMRLALQQGEGQTSVRHTGVGINASGELEAFESHNGTTATGSALAQDQDHLVVVRLEELGGIPDSMHVWLNPDLDAEPALGTADIAITANFLYVGNNALFDFDTYGVTARLNNSSASDPEDFVFFDEFRLGTTYADVTPFNVLPVAPATPEPSTLVMLSFGVIGFGLRHSRNRR